MFENSSKLSENCWIMKENFVSPWVLANDLTRIFLFSETNGKSIEINLKSFQLYYIVVSNKIHTESRNVIKLNIFFSNSPPRIPKKVSSYFRFDGVSPKGNFVELLKLLYLFTLWILTVIKVILACIILIRSSNKVIYNLNKKYYIQGFKFFG